MTKDYEEKSILLLKEFCECEYSSLLEYEDTSKIYIMYTEYTEEEVQEPEIKGNLNVQVYVNLKDLKMCLEYNDILVYEEIYGSQKDMLEQLESLDFDSWVNLDEINTYKNKLKERGNKENE